MIFSSQLKKNSVLIPHCFVLACTCGSKYKLVFRFSCSRKLCICYSVQLCVFSRQYSDVRSEQVSSSDQRLHSGLMYSMKPQYSMNSYVLNELKYNTECGYFSIFLSLRFYVKSVLKNAKVQKMPFLPIQRLLIRLHWQISDFKKCKNS